MLPLRVQRRGRQPGPWSRPRHRAPRPLIDGHEVTPGGELLVGADVGDGVDRRQEQQMLEVTQDRIVVTLPFDKDVLIQEVTVEVP